MKTFLFSISNYFTVVFIGCLLATTSCNEPAPPTSAGKRAALYADTVNTKALAAISKAKSLLTDGALITRSDDDFESLTWQNFNQKEQAFSHAGIAFLEHGQYVVYNPMAGFENPDGKLRREPFDSFVSPYAKKSMGIFQYQLSAKEISALHDVIRKFYTDKNPFDMKFDLKTDDSLYCSEMIYKGLKAATNGRIELPHSYLENYKPKVFGYKFSNEFLKKADYIGIDDLYLNPFCKELIRIKY